MLALFSWAGLLRELSGDDYQGTFRLAHPLSDDVLPPYAETVRFDAGPRLTGSDLRRSAY